MLEKKKKESKKNDAQEKIDNRKEQNGERRSQSRESPNVTKNTAQASLEKIITEIQRQL